MKICNRITLGIAGVFAVIAAFLYTTGEGVVLRVGTCSIDAHFLGYCRHRLWVQDVLFQMRC